MMKKTKKYFYFASPHSFKYPFFVHLKFVKRNDCIIQRSDHSKWMEVKNYTYYGEPVTCIIPAQNMEYGFVFSLLNSEDSDNIFGAINYLLCNYRERFIMHIEADILPSIATNIIFRYFKKDIQIGQ